MRSDIRPGAIFPDYELPDQTGTRRKLSEIQGGDPMILVLARGHYCPKDRRQLRNLVELYPEIRVAYTKIVTISTDHPPRDERAARRPRALAWPFLSDPGPRSSSGTSTSPSTPTRTHNPMIPYTFVLAPGLRIHSMYNGYWYWGRPSNEELRRDLREVTRAIRPDWDLGAPGLRERPGSGDAREEVLALRALAPRGPRRSRLMTSPPTARRPAPPGGVDPPVGHTGGVLRPDGPASQGSRAMPATRDRAVPDGAYFPGPLFWQAHRSPDAPRSPATSGLTQPPIHARAALELHRRSRDVDASRAFLRSIYPRLVAAHESLDRRRDPRGIGLPAIVHPWESGLDNSPVWDRILAGISIEPGQLPRYQRCDLVHARPEDRPTDRAYDVFVYLASRYRDVGYDDRRMTEVSPFLVVGPLFVAIHLWSTHALAEIARIVGADPRPHVEAAERIHAALLDQLWDPVHGRFAVRDLVRDALVEEETIVSFAPLLDPELPSAIVASLVTELESACFHPSSAVHFIVPTTSLESAGFDRRRYWRGPVWLNTNWLLEAALRQHGRHELADEIAATSLALVERSGFHECFDPLSGAGYGSADFGWTAALAIDFARRVMGASPSLVAGG
ncbi:MAG: hypothetical protein KatS3mg065_0933 [Chloroflexota bacterium]|nr:MAG: hypothetical protein KatS3mg065_0933 [Chloroflexota bacterium]